MKRARVDFPSVYKCLIGRCKEDRANIFLVELSDRTTDSKLKSKHRKFRLDQKSPKQAKKQTALKQTKPTNQNNLDTGLGFFFICLGFISWLGFWWILFLSCKCDQLLKQVAEGGCKISIPGNSQKSTANRTNQPAVAGHSLCWVDLDDP